MPDAQGPGVDLRAVEAFLFHEAALLDGQRFEEWLDLYTADATYWVPLVANQKDPFGTSSLIYDDRKLLETRVRKPRHPRTHAQSPAPRTCHLVTNVVVAADRPTDGTLLVRSNLMLVEYRREKQRTFAGAVEHRLLHEAKSFRIRAKRIDLVNSEATLDGISILF
jgi:3-phenylpropionate/cinnamic acid dioxygenase small subunit